MSEGALEASRVRSVVRLSILLLLVTAPLAFGSVHEAAYYPLLVVACLAGLVSWGHAHWARAHGLNVPRVPATPLLLGLHVLVFVQLLPLPPGLLRLVSPGSFSFYDYLSLVPLHDWHPITVSPADTLRGLAFLAALSLLHAAAFREFAERRWRRRAVVAIVGTAFVMTLEALFQAASHEPTRIYGIWKPTWDWGVFGPYVSKNHFAGYIAMALPLSMAWAGSAFGELRRSWRRRRVGWLALGEPAGTALMRRLALVLTLIVGVVASRSRGGLMSFVLAVAATPLILRRRRWAAMAVALLMLAGLAALGSNGLVRSAAQGLRDPRFEVWPDALRMLPHFPFLGAGMNAFGTAYPRYQTVWKSVWFGEAHNDYLQSLFDLGAVGFGLVIALVLRLLTTAARNASTSTISAGLLGSVLASTFHALVDFNWQIPANAATFAVLAGLAMQPQSEAAARLDPPEGRA